MRKVMLWLLSIVLILTVLRNGWYLLNTSLEGVLILYTAVGIFAIVLMYLVVSLGFMRFIGIKAAGDRFRRNSLVIPLKCDILNHRLSTSAAAGSVRQARR